jgi:K+-transporting ATPase KdpF subunit
VTKSEGGAMNWEYALGIVLAVLLFAYLAYALLKPERF